LHQRAGIARRASMRFRTAQFALILAPLLPAIGLQAQQPDEASIIHALDAENQARFANVQSFTDLEHYVVYRGADAVNPAAQMTVRMTYKRGTGKTYEILSQSGSTLVLKYGLLPLLDNEKAINDPAKVSQSWFTSANYAMKLKPGIPQTIDGRLSLALAVTPLRKAPNMIEGTLWIDIKDHNLVEVEGIASKSPSIFAGVAHIERHYTNMEGYAMATRARAESSSAIFGRTVISIDYSDYHFEIRTAQ
jgi:hypothetical protein